MKEIDCDRTDEIVCPYCGYEFSDSYEYRDSGVIDCGDCDRKINLTVDYSVSYSTSKIPCANGEGEHRWRSWIAYGDTKESRCCKDCDKREYREVEGKQQ